MTPTLLQKHPLKGTREFSLVDDEVQFTIRSPIKTESLAVVLNVLDSRPVVSGSTLSFISQVNQEPLVEMFLDKPDKESFEFFVNAMQQRIIEEDFSLLRARNKEVDASGVRESIEMLQQYVDTVEIEALLAALAELEANPEDMQCLNRVAKEFNDLGFVQGQVLTYAPYINFLLSGQRT